MLEVQLLSISLLDIYHVTKAFQQTIKGSLSKHKYKNNTLYILSLSVRNIFCFVLLILELVLYVYVGFWIYMYSLLTLNFLPDLGFESRI